ncbi:MAG: family 4 glycosyl hydrolase [Acidimicrobiales bacterium]
MTGDSAGDREHLSGQKALTIAILGGGGVRTPPLVRALLASDRVKEIRLFEPSSVRRDSIGRLALDVADRLGRHGAVSVPSDVEIALADVDFVIIAIRVGGDQGRVVDEAIALRHGLVGQETVGPGGAAMALRNIPVVLRYCEVLRRVSPGAVVVNCTNPVGIITQAIVDHGGMEVVGVCDTPGGAVESLCAFLGLEPAGVAYGYGGLNHLGWISSVRVGRHERLPELLQRFEELAEFDGRFAVFDPDLVRDLGAIPTDYLYYLYHSDRYVSAVARAGRTRGQEIALLNEKFLDLIAEAWKSGDSDHAWSVYSQLMDERHASYMRVDLDRGVQETLPHLSLVISEKRRRSAWATMARSDLRGYEGIALRVIAGLSGDRACKLIINVANSGRTDYLDVGDVVEVPAMISQAGVEPLEPASLPRSARALVMQVKEFERRLVDAAVAASPAAATRALALHPLVPGTETAEALLAEYIEAHGADLAYLRPGAEAVRRPAVARTKVDNREVPG